jgi:hypothetical protein
MSRGSNDPSYGGHLEPNHEEIWEQTGALDPVWSAEAVNGPEQANGDVLSDGWDRESDDALDPEPEAVPDPGIETGVHMALDPRLMSDDHEWTEGERWDDRAAQEPEEWDKSQQTDDWDNDAHVAAADPEQSKPFPGAGWRETSYEEEEEDEGRKRKSKGLLLAAAVTVVTATAGGWMLFASLGDSSDRSCPQGSQCASVGQVGDTPADAVTEEPPVEDTILPSEPDATPTETGLETTQPTHLQQPAPTSTANRPTQHPSERPTATRSRPPAEPTDPGETQEPKFEETDRPEPEQPNPSPTKAPPTKAPPSTQAPPPPPPPEKKEDEGGGLLDWLFGG